MSYEVLPKPVSPYANGFVELNRIPILKAPDTIPPLPPAMLQSELYKKDAGIYQSTDQKVFQDKLYSQVQDSYVGKEVKTEDLKPMDKSSLHALIKAIDFSKMRN